MSLTDERVLYIGNLPNYTNEKEKSELKKEILKLFSTYGQVDGFKMKESKNYGFLCFHYEYSAQLVLQDHEEKESKSRLEKSCGNRKDRKNLSAQFHFSCYKEYQKVDDIPLRAFNSKVDSGEISLPDHKFWIVTEPPPLIFYDTKAKLFQYIVPQMSFIDEAKKCDDSLESTKSASSKTSERSADIGTVSTKSGEYTLNIQNSGGNGAASADIYFDNANSSCKKSDSHGAGNASVAGTSSDDGSNNNNKQSDGSTNGAIDKILNDYVSTDVVGTSSGSGNKKASDGSTPVAGKTPGGDKKLNVNVGTQVAGTSSSGGHVSRFSKKASDGSTPVAGKTPGGDKKLNVNVGTQVAGTSSSGGHVSRFSKKASDGSTPVAGKTPGGDKKLNVNVGTQVAGTSSSGHVSRNTTKESEGSTLVAGSSTGSHVSNKASDGSALAPRRYKVLFQKDFKDKIEEYKKHYANLDQLAYVVVQSINRHKDDINYPISGIKGLKLVTKNKKKTLLVNVEFEGDWPQEEKQMWCTHSNVAASELIERYMVENDLEWEVDFRGYTKNKKKCYVDVESESEDEEYEDEAAELKKRIDKYKNILD